MASTILLLCVLLFLLFLAAIYIAIYLLSTEVPRFKILFSSLWNVIKTIYIYGSALLFVKKCQKFNQSVPDLFKITLQKYKDRVCFVFQDEEWTFQQVNEFSNKIANYFLSQGYKKGDEVALIMENCPEYACIWLGLSKIGVVGALINTNLREDALGHSINVIDTKAIIFGKNLSNVVNEVKPFLEKKNNIDYYCYSTKEYINIPETSPAKSLNSILDDASPKDIDLGAGKPNFSDKIFYIYTSGTTGLPKPAIIKHNRFIWIGASSHITCQLNGYETFYNPLPMYHTSGGILFLGTVLIIGGKMVLRKKFSASNFWKDVCKYKVTVSQYIGETCRYLLNQPKTPEETQHCLKVVFGNGLKAHLWKEFQERFQIKNIVEVYGSTEGNTNLVNFFNKVGAVGFLPRIFNLKIPLALMRINEETGEILRNENGLAVRCKIGEPGELVGTIIRDNPLKSFDGYASEKDTNKKIVRDCFVKGDTAFRSGDILTMDEYGYVYFVDRTGDTFRWKGENCSTGEVENIVSKCLNHVTCVVYGVEIPKTEGRAGMAALEIDVNDLDFKVLYQNLKKKLPSYAVPMFLRITQNLEVTGTYKLRKVSLQKEGYNPEQITDPLFFLDNKQQTYVPLTKELYSDIVNGKLKL